MEKIVKVHAITQKHLEALLKGDAYCIHIPGYIQKDEIRTILSSLYQFENKQEEYPAIRMDSMQHSLPIDYGISFIGSVSNRASGKKPDDPAWKEYFQKRDSFKTMLSEMALAQKTPIERLVQLFNNLHPHGASTATFFNQEASYGGFRFTYAGEKLEKHPHIDTPRNEFDARVSFSINVYLTVPNQGRELLIWDTAPIFDIETDHLDAYLARYTGDQIPTRIRVEAGDAVVFNSCVPHGVASFVSQRPSIAQQTFFIGSPDAPLQFYN